MLQQKPGQQIQDPELLKKKIIASKIIVSILALVCIILVIFILSKSSVFFGYLFSLSTETTIKLYLKSHFQNFMAALYISIIGFVICFANAIVFFFKFSQKDKIVWFHGGYFLIFFISGIVALTNTTYNDYMKTMSTANLSTVSCSLLPSPFQCSLCSPYLAYKDDFTAFYITFVLFFILYAIVYHYSVLKLLPFQQQFQMKQRQQKKQIYLQNASTILDGANKNVNVSDMFVNDFLYYQ